MHEIISFDPQAESLPVCLLFIPVDLNFDSVFQDVCLGSKCVLLFIQALFRNLLLLSCLPPILSFSVPDALPPSQYTDAQGSDSWTDSVRMFQRGAPPSKPQTSHRPVEQMSYYSHGIQSDQLHRGVVLGPPGSPQGIKSVSQALTDDRLRKLERRMEELARMLDMVKAQVTTIFC